MAAKTTKKSNSGSASSGKSKPSAKTKSPKAVAKTAVKKISKKSPAAKPTKQKTGLARPVAVPEAAPKGRRPSKGPSSSRKQSLKKILLAKRTELIRQIQAQLGQSLTDEQQRRLEAAMDSGDQALVDLDREMGISLQEMRNRERQMIDDALASLEEGTYGRCAECDVEISEKRLEALPFARYCIECQSHIELLQKIEKGEQRS